MTDRQRFSEPREGQVFADDERRALEAVVREGVGGVQLREKNLDGGPLFARARDLVTLCTPTSTRVVVNDRADVARVANAHGVHLPEAGLSIDDARSLVGNERLLGRSIHEPVAARESKGVDYLIFGPIFDTPSKRRYGAPQGLERLAEVSRTSDVPVFAIGGITPARVHGVLKSGAAGIAVMGAILSAEDPASVVREFRNALARP